MSRRDQRIAAYDRPAPAGNAWSTSLLVVLIALLAGAAGFVMPHVVGGGSLPMLSWESLAGHPESKAKRKPPSARQAVSIPFGEALVNLAEDRLTRHLHVRVTLLTHGADEATVEAALESNRAVLMNWLISYLSDKSLEEVRGAAGMNRARRDIQDRFNGLLFADGSEKIRDVLFEEFTVR